MAPREVAGILVEHRVELRRCYRDTVAVLDTSAFEAAWVRSHRRVVPIINEICVRLHDRYSERPGMHPYIPEPLDEEELADWRPLKWSSAGCPRA